MDTFTPIEYLKIDIASNFGLDKTPWQERLDWFAENQDQLLSLRDQAKEPCLYVAGILAYEKACRGEPTGYAISLDATASGAQIMATLVQCEKSARLCNVVDTGDREDFYRNVYKLMLKQTGTKANLTLQQVKEAVMPWFYGSEAEPIKAFGTGDLLDTFYDVMAKEAPGIDKLNKALLGLTDPTATSYEWVLPDNFHVKIKVMASTFHYISFAGQEQEIVFKKNQAVEKDKSLGANSIHSVDGLLIREAGRRCMYDVNTVRRVRTVLGAKGMGTGTADDAMVETLWNLYLESGFLSARILDHLYADNMGLVDADKIRALLDTLPKKPFKILTVHDCFRVHPNYANDIRRQYNQLLTELAQSKMLAFITSQIARAPRSAEPFGYIADKIPHANYALS